MNLYDKLKKHAASYSYPFHMPGHKRQMGMPREACAIDITEIEGFDNLHHAEGILKEAQLRAAKLYGSEDTYYLVNGSTAGILAAVSACVKSGGKLLMARNSHKAAYHAVELRGIRSTYLYPGDSISPKDVQEALENDREIEAVFITSPTYEGEVSDVEQIANIAHSFGVPLIVDEAHGAHFGFHPCFPVSSVKAGADIVIHSLHKTLPSMTQTALLHRNGSLVNSGRIQKYLDIYQTSSPSYVMMASMDACIELLENRGMQLFDAFAECLNIFTRKMEEMKKVHLIKGDAFANDPSKLVLAADGHSGKWLADCLRERFGLEMEMTAGDYVIALTSIADSREGFDRLLKALQTLDAELLQERRKENRQNIHKRVITETVLRNEQVMTIADADVKPHEKIALEMSEHRISAEYIYVYPPGIPMIVPGERISRELLVQLENCRALGLTLQGLQDYLAKTINVI